MPARMRLSCGEASSLISPLGSIARRMAVEQDGGNRRSAAARSASRGNFAASPLNVCRTPWRFPSAKQRPAVPRSKARSGHREPPKPALGIGERAESELGAGAQISDCFADQRKFRSQERSTSVGDSSASSCAPSRGARGKAADDFFQLVEFEKLLLLDATRVPQIGIVAWLGVGNQNRRQSGYPMNVVRGCTDLHAARSGTEVALLLFVMPA